MSTNCTLAIKQFYGFGLLSTLGSRKRREGKEVGFDEARTQEIVSSTFSYIVFFAQPVASQLQVMLRSSEKKQQHNTNEES